MPDKDLGFLPLISGSKILAFRFNNLNYCKMDPEKEVLNLHSALKAKHGSVCRRNLNKLTTTLKSLAVCSTGLVFLLRCRQMNVFPSFIKRAIKVCPLGHFMERLAYRLPRRMLRAAIRDLRSRQSRLQTELDFLWSVLYRMIPERDLWNALVLTGALLSHRRNDSCDRLTLSVCHA